MDRKALRNWSALASFGAILSVGCGLESVGSPCSEPARSATIAPESEPQTVVVPRAAASPDAVRERAGMLAVEEIASAPVKMVAAVEEIPAEPIHADTATESASSAVPLDGEAADDNELAAETEIRFALPSNGSAGAAAVEAREARSKPVGEASPRRELTPVLVTPREVPAAPMIEPRPAQPTTAPERVARRPEPPTTAPESVARRPEPPASPLVEVAPEVAAEPQLPPAPRTQLPPAPEPVRRSPAFAAAMVRAHERVRHGIQLAEKRALYAARKEFVSAVKTIAQANDLEHGTRKYTQAAVGGFVALKEANDFLSQGAGLAETAVSSLIATHRTPVLKDADVADLPPAAAAQYYFDYAGDQLAAAIDRQTIGSISLYGLGKIIISGAGPNAKQLEYTGPAMALYRAALIAEPQNFRAANELGVLLAGMGQLELAREMLVGTATLAPQPLVWRNLATVHARMGEHQLAQQAAQRAEALRETHSESTAPQVEWVDPATFASTTSVTDSTLPAAALPQNQPTTAKRSSESTASKPTAHKKRLDRWNPLNLRR